LGIRVARSGKLAGVLNALYKHLTLLPVEYLNRD
jgi:hypothetical protein